MADIKTIAVITIYVEDYQKALDFYSKFLGFEKKGDMTPKSCWGKAGAVNLYIEGGHKKIDLVESDTRASVVFVVDSANDTFNEFKNGGVELLSSEPMKMSDKELWFLFKDPAGNILEIYSENNDQ